MMSAVVSGEAYVAAINLASADRESRRAFQHLALSLLDTGGSLFDFGCGPGLDACHYAEHGRRVGAYDIDPDMRAFFDRYCAVQIARGVVHQYAGTYADFLRDPAPPGGVNAGLITANFAPLNLVPDPRSLFAKFSTMLDAKGHVLVSVLNPAYVGDLRYGWWWRNVPRLCMLGEYAVAGAQAPVARYSPRRLAALAPQFELQAIYEDRFLRGPPQRLPPKIAVGPRGWRRLATCRFIFLLFRLRERP